MQLPNIKKLSHFDNNTPVFCYMIEDLAIALYNKYEQETIKPLGYEDWLLKEPIQ